MTMRERTGRSILRYAVFGVIVLGGAGIATSWFAGAEIICTLRANLIPTATVSPMSGPMPLQADAVTRIGFPLHLGADIRDLRVSDGMTDGLMIGTQRVTATAPVWSPLDWRADIALPLNLTLHGMRFTLMGTDAQMRLRSGYHASWPVDRFNVTLTDPAATWEAAAAPSLAAASLSVEAHQIAPAPDAPTLYDITATATGVKIPDGLARSMTRGDTFGDVIERLALAGTVGLSHPFALTPQDVPQITSITLRPSELVWSGHRIALSGQLSVNDAGTPEGRLMLRVSDWQDWLTLAQGALMIDRRAMPILMLLGQSLAAASGDGSVELPLIFHQGRMSLGPVPLGPAPVLR